MKLLINIGNTHVQICSMCHDGPVLQVIYETQQILSDGMLPLLERQEGKWSAVVSTVVPALREPLEKRYGNRLFFLGREDFPQLDFSAMDVRTLGMDRIANAAGAVAWSSVRPVVVLDCGTCLVTEAVDASNRFLGGAIIPGRMMLRRALSEHTAQLPLVPLDNSRPSALGVTTQQAIRNGVDQGAVGAVRQLIAETRRELGTQDCPVLTTGGDAAFFLNMLPELQPAPNLLIIRGMATSIRFQQLDA